MREELKHAYPALTRQWTPHGKVFRRDGVRGEPDFMLTSNAWPRIPMYVEVKAAQALNMETGLSRPQAERLDDLARARLLSRLLVYVDNRYWLVSDGPFLNELEYVRTRVELRWREARWLTPGFLGFSEFLMDTRELLP